MCYQCHRPAHGRKHRHLYLKTRVCTQCDLHCRWDRHWAAMAAAGSTKVPPLNDPPVEPTLGAWRPGSYFIRGIQR